MESLVEQSGHRITESCSLSFIRKLWKRENVVVLLSEKTLIVKIIL